MAKVEYSKERKIKNEDTIEKINKFLSREYLEMLSKLYEERQISIVLVSHNMDDVAKYADRILVMNEGELVLDGVPKKVFHYQDELEQIGLGVPQMTHLIHRLEKETGCRLGDAITLEEGLPLIEQWWHAKGTSR